MTREERLAALKARRSQAGASGLQVPASGAGVVPEPKPNIYDWLKGVFDWTKPKNLRNDSKQAESKPKQPAPKVPSRAPSVATEARKQKQAARNAAREALKHKKLYEEAVAKGVVKDGSLDSIRLKEVIKSDYGGVRELVDKAVASNIKTAQDAGGVDSLQHRQLVRSGVQYVDKNGIK